MLVSASLGSGLILSESGHVRGGGSLFQRFEVRRWPGGDAGWGEAVGSSLTTRKPPSPGAEEVALSLASPERTRGLAGRSPGSDLQGLQSKPTGPLRGGHGLPADRKEGVTQGTRKLPQGPHPGFPLPHSQCNFPATAQTLARPCSPGPGSLAFEPWACIYTSYHCNWLW